MDLYVCLILIFLFIHQFEIDVNQKKFRYLSVREFKIDV